MGNSLTGGVGGVEIPGLSASVPKQKGYVGRSDGQSNSPDQFTSNIRSDARKGECFTAAMCLQCCASNDDRRVRGNHLCKDGTCGSYQCSRCSQLISIKFPNRRGMEAHHAGALPSPPTLCRRFSVDDSTGTAEKIPKATGSNICLRCGQKEISPERHVISPTLPEPWNVLCKPCFQLRKCPECPKLCIRSGEKFIALENMSIHRPCLLRAIDELKSDLRKVRCELENKPSGDWVNTGLGLRWVKVEPNACTREIQSVPLSAALKNKADFTKSELNAFFLGNLYHDSYIKVGNTSFKPIEGPIPFPTFQLTEKDLPILLGKLKKSEEQMLEMDADSMESLADRMCCRINLLSLASIKAKNTIGEIEEAIPHLIRRDDQQDKRALEEMLKDIKSDYEKIEAERKREMNEWINYSKQHSSKSPQKSQQKKK